jgi:small-conductance mechanosensitive channel
MIVEQITNWLEIHLQNQYWRVGFIIGAALVLALILRILLMPLLYRLARKSASDFDDQVLDRLGPAITRTVILMGANLAIQDYVEDPQLEGIIASVAATLLILIWGRFAVQSGTLIFKKLSQNADRYQWIQPQTLPLIQFIFKVLVFGLITYLLMSAWHVNLTSWLASAGVLGIAVGFAAKDTLANFISGVFILVDSPYKVGQYIIIDGESRGVVTDIGIRSTRLLTRDNVEVTLPNAVIGNAKIVNESSGPNPRMRVRVNCGVAYGSDVDQVRDILRECVKDVPHACEDQAPVVRFVGMGESSLDFQALVWVQHPVFRGRVIDHVNTRIYKALSEAGIEIPFPQRDLHIKEWPSPPPA